MILDMIRPGGVAEAQRRPRLGFGTETWPSSALRASSCHGTPDHQNLYAPRTGRLARCLLAVAAVLVPAGPAWSAEPGIEMKLEASADQAGAVPPYRAAELTLTNRSTEMLREVRLQWTEGGPTVICPVALAPDAEQIMRVFLPAGAPLQTYRATFRGDPLLGPAEVTIPWPIEHAAREAWVSPSAYEPYGQSLPAWSGQVRLNVMLGTAIVALAAAATLFLQARAIRTWVILAVVAAATGAGALMLAGTDVLVEVVIALDKAQPGIEASPGRNLHVVATRRTVRWSHPDASLAPVYRDESQMSDEMMTLHPRHGAVVVVAPGQLRLFRATPGG